MTGPHRWLTSWLRSCARKRSTGTPRKADSAEATARRTDICAGLAHCQVAIPGEAHLARLTQTGSGICSLYELELTFDQVLTNLGLASMPADERERIRRELEIVMDRGLSEISGSRKLNPEGRLQSQDIAASLRSIAHHLQASGRALRGRQTGLQQASHILVANKARESLAMDSRNWRQRRCLFE